ncbi:MAG: type II toxin-antitoxin system HicA family toxin [Gammaproteobacteria bacterium]|jgi:predicted RNA binding protein YcfA (HicA-like mRNA interferase family)|nr:MAG: type II toxin-antitoxin system HicA family toxin [Gammaproteobacteria bacterium]
MTRWPSVKAKRLFSALERIGWKVKRVAGSHKVLARSGFPDYVFAFHDQEEIGPKMVARVAKRTGLQPHNL